MRKDTYRIGDGTFAFSPAVFDSLLGHGAKGAARMRELAGAMHVSISSIKDWRRGTQRLREGRGYRLLGAHRRRRPPHRIRR
jgi:isocitrate dehydrogenase kinase/phosphatase